MPSDTPSAAQLAIVTYLTGINQTGTMAGPSYWTWNQNNPATYSTSDDAHKWSNDSAGNALSLTSAAGTAGGTVTYAFDPASNLTTAQKNAFIASLTLWSDEANINFVLTTDTATADVLLSVNNTVGTYEESATAEDGIVGDTMVPDELPPASSGGSQAVINFNNAGAYGTLGSFTLQGGYSYSALTHEVGHLLGLGHTGAYNDGNGAAGADQAPNVQDSPFDSRQWSVMSYIDPSDTSAADDADYTVTGTDWSETTGNTTYQVAPETPMMLDILAAQRLDGAPSGTALSGGQVFGFNTNITDASAAFFNFAVNIYPVVTLWDAGGGNTLDLSGYSTASTVDLLPGTFSSAGGLTNNIGIAFGTAIDSAIGGAGNDSFTVNTDDDTINGGGGTNTAVFSSTYAGYTFSNVSGALRVTDTATQTYDDLTGIAELQFTNETVAAATIETALACFAAGTRIATPRGDMAVERLAAGDSVWTVDGRAAPVRRVGHRHVDCRRHPRPDQVRPVRIAAHAFAPGQPERDLLLSPDHAVFAEGVLVPVKYLVNGGSVAQVARDAVTYWHVELHRHEVLLADGLPCESYLDTDRRGAPAATCQALWERAGAAPLRICGAEVERIAATLRGDARPAAPPPPVADPALLLQPDWYLATYRDVAMAGDDPLAHFTAWGRGEGRLPCPEADLLRGLGLVDLATVVFAMPDVVAAGVDPVAHFCAIGWRERRRPNPCFDTGWYLETHDVPEGMNPLLHYVLLGEARGLAPGPGFDPVGYRARQGLAPGVSPLAHYLRHRGARAEREADDSRPYPPKAWARSPMMSSMCSSPIDSRT